MNKFMRNKILKFFSKTSPFFTAIFTHTFLGVTRALAQELSSNITPTVVYAPPEVFVCGGNKLCSALYVIKRSWVFFAIALAVLLAIIFGTIKLIKKFTKKSKPKNI